jgi:predicted nucleic acid-binding protein
MKPTILDTDTLSAFFKGNQNVLQNMSLYLDTYDCINVSIMTYYEVLNGLLYKDANVQLKRFYEFMEQNNVVLLTIESVNIAAKIQADLRKNGREIGHVDTLIAGVALSHDFQLITNNTRHFSRVDGLSIDNWMNE